MSSAAYARPIVVESEGVTLHEHPAPPGHPGITDQQREAGRRIAVGQRDGFPELGLPATAHLFPSSGDEYRAAGIVMVSYGGGAVSVGPDGETL